MRRRVVAGFIATCLVLPALVRAERLNRPLRDDDVVARVNGTVIYRKAVRDVVQGILVVQDQAPDEQSVNKLADQALDSLIAFELLYQESQARGVTVSDADVDAEIKRTKERFPDDATYRRLLKARGMTEASLRKDTRKTLAVSRLLEGGIWKDIRISPEQVKSFYERNRAEFKHPAQLRASHILIRVEENATPAAREAAKQKALDLLKQLKAGADFAQLARTQSQDPASAPHGGDLGFFAKGEMDEAFEKQAFALAPGQVSDVVSTVYGFQIIKVTERRDAGVAPLTEVEDRIRSVLTKRERQQREEALVAQLRRKGKVEVLDH